MKWGALALIVCLAVPGFATAQPVPDDGNGPEAPSCLETNPPECNDSYGRPVDANGLPISRPSHDQGAPNNQGGSDQAGSDADQGDQGGTLNELPAPEDNPPGR
jgi:hypothetical protein